MRVPASALALLLATVCAATVCMAQQEPTFHVDVPLVNVFVSVTDKAGAPIGGLAKEDFQLSENGKPQTIAVFERDTSAPLAIVMAVDLSGSMYKDFAAEQQAAQRFAKDVLRKQDRADLVAFADGTNEVTGFTGDAKRIAGGLNGLRPGSGGTAFYSTRVAGIRAAAAGARTTCAADDLGWRQYGEWRQLSGSAG